MVRQDELCEWISESLRGDELIFQKILFLNKADLLMEKVRVSHFIVERI